MVKKQYFLFISKKIFSMFFYLFLALSLTFLAINVLPGDPAYTLALYYVNQYRMNIDDALRIARQTLGIEEKPLYLRYLDYITNIFRGGLGTSIYYKRPVIEVIKESLPWTLFVLTLSTLFSYLIGIRLGSYSAYKRGSRTDAILYSTAIVLMSTPSFIMGILILYVFGVYLRVLPLGGAYPINVKPSISLKFIVGVLYHATGPILAQMLATLSGWILTTRNLSVTILEEDYVKFAFARGLSDSTIVSRYLRRHAKIPITTGLALSLGYMMGGSTLVESVFRYPGMGYQLGLAIGSRDLNLMSGILTLIVTAVILSSLLVELIYPLIDPRVKVE